MRDRLRLWSLDRPYQGNVVGDVVVEGEPSMACKCSYQGTVRAAAGLKPPPGLDPWRGGADAAPGGVLK